MYLNLDTVHMFLDTNWEFDVRYGILVQSHTKHNNNNNNTITIRLFNMHDLHI